MLMIVYWRRTSLLGLNLWWGKGLAFVSETAFNLEHGAWSMEHGAWSTEHGARSGGSKHHGMLICREQTIVSI